MSFLRRQESIIPVIKLSPECMGPRLREDDILLALCCNLPNLNPTALEHDSGPAWLLYFEFKRFRLGGRNDLMWRPE